MDEEMPLSVQLNGRQPPHSAEAEEHLLSCIFMDGVLALQACMDGKITAECFYVTANRDLYQTFLWLFKNSRDLSLEVLAEELKRVNKLDEIGGWPYLVQVSGRVATTAQLLYFIERVRETYVQRELIKTCGSTCELAYETGAEVEKFTFEINRILSIRNGTQMIKTLAQAAEENMALIERIRKGEATADDMGISWAWDDMNRVFGTKLPGELIVVAARPGCGKSTIARQDCLHVAKHYGDTLLFSREMPIEQISALFAQTMSRRSWRTLRRGQMHPKDVEDFERALKEVRNARNIHIFDKDKTVSQIMARAMAFGQIKKPRYIIADYLQAYNPEQAKNETRDVAIGRFTRSLKDLAIDLKIPVLLLAQVSRSFEREDREPRMSDLRESGNIEQDADTIIFLHAPKKNEFTGADQDLNDETVENIHVRATMVKGRNNGTGRFDFLMHRPTTTFHTVAKGVIRPPNTQQPARR